jgi:hypothetical protein
MTATDIDRLRQALSEADFPADKDDLVGYAERAAADDDTVRALRALPPVPYANLGEVVQSVSLDPARSDADRAAQRRTHTKPGLSEQEKDIPSNPITEEFGVEPGR